MSSRRVYLLQRARLSPSMWNNRDCTRLSLRDKGTGNQGLQLGQHKIQIQVPSQEASTPLQVVKPPGKALKITNCSV